jgi:hypothetical protein
MDMAVLLVAGLRATLIDEAIAAFCAAPPLAALRSSAVDVNDSFGKACGAFFTSQPGIDA